MIGHTRSKSPRVWQQFKTLSRRIFQRRNIALRHWNSTCAQSIFLLFLFPLFPISPPWFFVYLSCCSSYRPYFLSFFFFSLFFSNSSLFDFYSLRFPLVSFRFFPFIFTYPFLSSLFSLFLLFSHFFPIFRVALWFLFSSLSSFHFLFPSFPLLFIFFSLLILFLPSLLPIFLPTSYRNIFPIFFSTIHIVTHTVQFETEEMQSISWLSTPGSRFFLARVAISESHQRPFNHFDWNHVTDNVSRRVSHSLIVSFPCEICRTTSTEGKGRKEGRTIEVRDWRGHPRRPILPWRREEQSRLLGPSRRK